jgi:hypothetical protein
MPFLDYFKCCKKKKVLTIQVNALPYRESNESDVPNVNSVCRDPVPDGSRVVRSTLTEDLDDPNVQTIAVHTIKYHGDSENKVRFKP